MMELYDDFLGSSMHHVESPYEFKLKVKTFIDGTVKMVMTKIHHRIPKTNEHAYGESISYENTPSEEKLKENLTRAFRRAKEQIQHAVRQIQADHMLTLTTRENIQSREQFFEVFTRFIRLVRTKDFINGELVTRSDVRNYQFACVPELQDRGAYHMHCAVVGYQDLKLLRACWYVALGGNIDDSKELALGQIDVTSQNKRWGAKTESWKLAKLVDYLTKYIAKSFEHDNKLGVHRYTKSRNIEPVNIQKQVLLSCYSNGGKGHIDAMKEVISYAEFLGLNDFFVWGRGEQVFTLEGKL